MPDQCRFSNLSSRLIPLFGALFLATAPLGCQSQDDAWDDDLAECQSQQVFLGTPAGRTFR